jgi:hypothetical protein
VLDNSKILIILVNTNLFVRRFINVAGSRARGIEENIIIQSTTTFYFKWYQHNQTNKTAGMLHLDHTIGEYAAITRIRGVDFIPSVCSDPNVTSKRLMH